METDGFQADTEDEEDDCICISAESGELFGKLIQVGKWQAWRTYVQDSD